MLSQYIIKPSTSPWSFPIWIVPKKLDSLGETKWRIVIDYRKLNDITVGESYPIPQINEILDQLGQSKYFTTLDLCSGFHQISISEKDTPKTAFTVPQGHFEFKRMPFGLKNTPATFQRLMNTALAGLQDFEHNNWMCTLPCVSVERKYKQQPYATEDASAKPNN
ncbi:unnamed protein product [Pieris macdunnoughi]|uniref:Reverse transcriptase domain-containing protein n=1 Tax=Pieris macdunnoughi TaxID=345717 RepID=A0A821W640_9NEOP|nr:unnamed protein product [Pieris macdunnoughi]